MDASQEKGGRMQKMGERIKRVRKKGLECKMRVSKIKYEGERIPIVKTNKCQNS